MKINKDENIPVDWDIIGCPLDPLYVPVYPLV